MPTGATTTATGAFLSNHEWVVFGGFAAMLIGLSLFNPKLAVTAGVGVMAVILLQHPTFFGVGPGGVFGG